MTNHEMLTECYTDMLITLGDVTNAIVNASNVDDITDLCGVAEKVSVILKRIGDTQLLEEVVTDIDEEIE